MIILCDPVYLPTAPMESLRIQSIKFQQQHPEAKTTTNIESGY